MINEKWSFNVAGFFLLMNSFVYGQDDLQKKQLLCLMQASRARYINMEAVFSCKEYQIDQNMNKIKLQSEMTIHWKQTPGKVSVREEVYYSSGKETNST